MAKAITNAAAKTKERKFGMDKNVLRMACDDGTTYVAERSADGRRWTVVARYDRTGERSVVRGRLPACVEAHLDGRTCSGPKGVDSKEYWSK